MPSSQTYNPAAAFGQLGSTSGKVIEYYTNNSAGTVATGDVVVLDTTSASATLVGQAGLGCKTTTTAGDRLVLGVVDGDAQNSVATTTFAVGASVPVVVRGVARVQISSNTVTTTDVLQASGTAKVASAPTAATATTNGDIGKYIGVPLQAQTAKDANSCILAYIGKM